MQNGCKSVAMIDHLPPFSEILAKIEARIEAAGMCIAEFCRAQGIAPSTWSRWRAGSHTPLYSKVSELIESANKLKPKK